MTMTWKNTNSLNEKIKFINDWLCGEFKFSILCHRYGISRPTGYDLVNRYKLEGIDAFKEKSREPHSIPHKISYELEKKLIQLKYRYPNWGPATIRLFLIENGLGDQCPAKSTIERVFREYNLIKPRKTRKRCPAHSEPLKHCTQPNEVWSADFKGQFYLKNKHLCYPLTISDNFSRFLIMCYGLNKINCNETIKLYEKAFMEFGLPDAIRTDNGQPFAGIGIGGLTRLSIWLLKLGIMPERIKAGNPQENGRHERMHRTLKDSAVFPLKYTMKEQQRIFDKFIHEYNYERPHQALNGKSPAKIYLKSKRQMPTKLGEIEYPNNFLIRKVRTNGSIRFGAKVYYVSELLIGETIGLEIIDENRAMIYFGRLRLGLVDRYLDKILRP